jgi:hypothetical protein
MILLLLAAAGFFQAGADQESPTFEEHILNATVIYQNSDHQVENRTKFWQSLSEASAELQPDRKELRLIREIVRRENLAPWLPQDASSKLELPGTLEFLKTSVLIWCIFELDLQQRPFAFASTTPTKLTPSSSPGDFAEVLALAVRQQTAGFPSQAANSARLVSRSSWAPLPLRELAEIVIRATDQAAPLPSEIIQEATEGQFTLLFFHTEHPYSERLDAKIEPLRETFLSNELAFHDVPIGFIAGNDLNGQLKPGEATLPTEIGPRVLAELFGCHVLPQAILIGPNQIPVARWPLSEWKSTKISQGPRQRHPWVGLIWNGLGARQVAPLQEVGKEAPWSVFRESWRALRKESPEAYSPRILSRRARYLEKPFLGMLLLAAETNRPPQVTLPREPESLHERIVVAWYRDRSESPGTWATFLEQAQKRRSRISALELADALLDLGIPSDETAKVLLNLALRGRSDWVLQSSALRALEFQETTESPKKLAKFAKSRIWQLRLAMTEALRGFHHVDAVPILIDLMDDSRLRIRISAAEGLRELTGASMGTTRMECLAWWNMHKVEFQFPDFLLRDLGNLNLKDSASETVAYFGLDLQSDHVLFLVDKSESMVWYGKWPGMIEELDTFLDNTGKSFRFNIAHFSDHLDAWEPELRPLSKRSRKDAMRYLQNSNPYGPTNLWEAIEETFESTNADTVVLLSDGKANRGDLQGPKELREGIRRINRYARLQIHTVYMWPGISIPYEANHRCTGKCPTPRQIDPVAWEKDLRKRLPHTTHGKLLASIATDTGGISTIGFGNTWHQRPP